MQSCIVTGKELQISARAIRRRYSTQSSTQSLRENGGIIQVRHTHSCTFESTL